LPVKPEPRGFNDVQTVCSNGGALGYDLQTSNIDVTGSGGNALSSTVFSWQASNGNVNVSGQSVGVQSGGVINDNLVNVTGVDQLVVYTVTPTGSVASGSCAGDVFTVSVTVKPMPVGVVVTQTVCSDVVLGVGATLSTNGVSVSAASYTLNSITFNPALSVLTASGGSPLPVSGGRPANDLIDDSWTNTTGASVDVIYTITPVSSAGCLG